MSALARLRSLAYSVPFLRFFMSYANVSHLPFLFPDHFQSLQAETWSNLMKALEDDDRDACSVSRVEYRKCSNGKKHEFLAVHIHHRHSNHTAVLVVDRTPDSPSEINNGQLPSSGHAAHSFTKSSSRARAHDQVLVRGTRDSEAAGMRIFKPYKLMATLSFGNPPSLLEFAVLLIVVHQHAPFYHILQYQCYWYCDAIWRVLEHPKYDPRVVPSGSWDTRGKYGPLSVGSDSLEEIQREFSEAMTAAQAHLQEKREQAEARDRRLRSEGMEEGLQVGRLEAELRVVEERKRAEDEKKRAEDERKRAEDERKRAEDERKRAEDEKKRAEDEKKRAEEERKRAEEEKKRAEEAERQVNKLREQLAGLGTVMSMTSAG